MKKIVTKFIIILLVFLVIGILIYRSPDETCRIKANPKDAIEIGRTYAYYLLNCDEKGLLKLSIDLAKVKVENSNFQQITNDKYTQLEKKKIDNNFIVPLFTELNNMELITLKKLESFIVMTFAYKSWDGIVEIPDKGKMLFSIGVRYYKPFDHRIVPKLVRKIANLPLLRNFTGRIGTTGRWVVFDYNYKYNLNDYFAWVWEEGENYCQTRLKESEKYIQQFKIEKWYDEIMSTVEGQSNFEYEWGTMEVEKQIDMIEKLYKTQKELIKYNKLKDK